MAGVTWGFGRGYVRVWQGLREGLARVVQSFWEFGRGTARVLRGLAGVLQECCGVKQDLSRGCARVARGLRGAVASAPVHCGRNHCRARASADRSARMPTHSILAEGAMTLPVTLSGGVLFAS